jgi:hypothetical protein
VFHGPIAAFDDEGAMKGIADGKTMREPAREHGIAGHLTSRRSRRIG